MKKKSVKLFFLFLIFPFSAQAYVDPSAANSFFQILIAFSVALSAYIKIYWLKIKNIFYKIKNRNSTTNINDETQIEPDKKKQSE